MLRLHRLEISGFKSFVDPTGLDFAGGVTAIVGPNGCGKSNLADAVTWVLGEQSAKTLRGETMEDVIFNGSESRKPLGLAEVSLTLLTDPSFPGAEEGRIELARRVFRSGESQYRMNGKRGAAQGLQGPADGHRARHSRLLGDRAGQDRPHPLRQAAGAAPTARGGGRASPATRRASGSPS